MRADGALRCACSAATARVRDLAVETGTPVRDAAIVLRLVNERIEALSDPLDPGFGFDILRLAVPHTEPLAAEQTGLMAGRDGAHELAALLDRLGARLGRERFCRLAPQGSHVPERTTRLVPMAQSGPAPLGHAAPGRASTAAAHLVRSTRTRRGTGASARWTAPTDSGGAAPRIASSPRKAPSGSRPNGGGGIMVTTPIRASPAIIIASRMSGRRFWLFRHGLYERETAQPHWYVHGLFA